MNLLVPIFLIAGSAALARTWRRKSEKSIAEINDDTCENLYSFGPEKRLNIELEIDYMDTGGNNTTRQIRLKRFACNESFSDAALMAHCYLRGQHRSFRASRVQRCVDISTGEIIRDIPRYLLNAYASSPDGLLEAMWQKHGDEINSLVYVGKLDGRLTKKEKQVIVDYILRRSLLNGIEEASLLGEISAVSLPSRQKFALCLGRLAAVNDFDKDTFVKAIEAMLATKKSSNGAELEVIPYVRKRLGLPK